MIPVLPLVLVLLAALLVSGILWFNRDPHRTPHAHPDAILAPADGLIVAVDDAPPPLWLEGPVCRIAIFLGLGDVHVQRTPIAGKVMFSQWQQGGYHPALDPRSAHNMGHWLGLEAVHRRVLVLRTAGIIARRVITSVNTGQSLAAGDRIGRILLGSRTEVFLPAIVDVLVKPGDHVRAGETILARWQEPLS
jgi:phosphatidylserine decarboxylase